MGLRLRAGFTQFIFVNSVILSIFSQVCKIRRAITDKKIIPIRKDSPKKCSLL